MKNYNDNSIYEGNSKQCLEEALDLCYAYFSPELDNFNGEKITVDDILFKVITEIDLLDDPNESLKEHAEESDYKWNANRNKAWRRKAISFLHKWGKEAEDDMYINMK